MLHIVKIFIAAILMSHSTALATEAKDVYTQKAFVQLMFQRFSWNQGLSKDASDRDYLQILGGKRTFKYEAENAFNEYTDRVTVRTLSLFGPFTGRGWILGVSDTTTANFTTLVPIKGEYVLKAVIKGNGFVWNIDGKQYPADSKSEVFREIEIGKMSLKAGIVNILVSIPPEGAIDSFSFTAPDHSPIQPLTGWRFKESLTAGQLAEIMVSMSGRHEQLPESLQNKSKKLSVIESAIIPPTAAPTTIAEFGKFISREWIRSDYRGAAIQIPVKNPVAGFYRITANAMGGRITGSVNEASFDVMAKPYLENIRLGIFRLEAGDNLITINLPPMGGIDLLELNMKNMNSEDYLALSGIKGPPERLVPVDEAESALNAIMVSNPVRR